jgi:hypothetical protein
VRSFKRLSKFQAAIRLNAILRSSVSNGEWFAIKNASKIA